MKKRYTTLDIAGHALLPEQSHHHLQDNASQKYTEKFYRRVSSKNASERDFFLRESRKHMDIIRAR